MNEQVGAVIGFAPKAVNDAVVTPVLNGSVSDAIIAFVLFGLMQLMLVAFVRFSVVGLALEAPRDAKCWKEPKLAVTSEYVFVAFRRSCAPSSFTSMKPERSSITSARMLRDVAVSGDGPATAVSASDAVARRMSGAVLSTPNGAERGELLVLPSKSASMYTARNGPRVQMPYKALEIVPVCNAVGW